jgi:hypothetical protein
MSEITDALNQYDIGQLKGLKALVETKIKDKEDETKLLVWRVQDGFVCLGSFRSEEYLKAVDFLVQKANELEKKWRENSVHTCRVDLHLEIKSSMVSPAEYESYFGAK